MNIIDLEEQRVLKLEPEVVSLAFKVIAAENLAPLLSLPKELQELMPEDWQCLAALLTQLQREKARQTVH